MPFPRNWRPWFVIACALAYTGILAAFSILQHEGFRTTLGGLGNADQSIWMAAHGDWTMPMSNDPSGQVLSRLAVHVNLFFLPISLLYRLWANPVILLVLTSAACGAGGVGLYYYARQRLGDTAWTLIPPFAFWLSPIVHDANLWEFHIITLYTAFLVWAIWAFAAERPLLAWALIAFALTCKEDVPLITGMLGVSYLLTGHRRRGAALLAVSAAYGALAFGVLAPAVNDGAGLVKLQGAGARYAWLGQGVGGFLTGIVTRPGAVLAHILRPDHIRLPIYLALSGALIAWRGWPRLLLMLTPILGALLAYEPNMARITGTYYWIACEAFIILACIDATARQRTDTSSGSAWPFGSTWRVHSPLLYLGAATCVFSLALTPLPYGLGSSWAAYAVPPEREAFAEVAARIPDDAAVCAQNNLGAHLAHRRDIAAFPRRCRSAQYALVFLRNVGGIYNGLSLRTGTWFQYHMNQGKLVRRVRRMILSNRWRLVVQREGFYLFARQGMPAQPRRKALEQLRDDAAHLRMDQPEPPWVGRTFARYLNGTWRWREWN